MIITADLAHAFKAACIGELEALKPGNVHIFADGHGMTVQDFMRSAEAVSEVIANPSLSLGERILLSVEATQKAVNCNTNLGVILLCAPMLQAAMVESSTYFIARLQQVLANTTQQDAVHVFKAIALANPAGLGATERFDVHEPPDCNLLVAMQAAAPRDMIAQQYANNFANIIDGLVCYQQALALWQRPAWAASAVHLHYMSQFPDTHIVRKFGDTIANLVKNEAKTHQEAFLKSYNPKNYQLQLMTFDEALKKRGLNPGTSADLTVATLLLHALM
jgi:triphosphoribosyl-dephospho-CoA synthase